MVGNIGQIGGLMRLPVAGTGSPSAPPGQPQVWFSAIVPPTANNKLSDYGLTTTRTVQDYAGNWVIIPANADPRSGLNPVENLYRLDPQIQVNGTDSPAAVDSTTNCTYTPNVGTVVIDGVERSYSKLVVTANGDAWASVYVSSNTLGLEPDAKLVSSVYMWLPEGAAARNGEASVYRSGDASSYDGDVVALSPTPQRLTVAKDYTGNASNTFSLTSKVFGAEAGDTVYLCAIALQDKIRRENPTVADPYVAVAGSGDPHHTGVDGFAYLDVDSLGNSVGPGRMPLQSGATNLADGTHDFSGGADTITLSATGYYTLSVHGTAAMTIAAGTATITGGAQATEGNPVTINCTATGTVTLTLDSGTLDEVDGKQLVQLESGSIETAPIPTDGGSASRATPNPWPTVDIPAEYETSNETRLTVSGLGDGLLSGDNSTFDSGVGDWSASTENTQTHNSTDSALKNTRNVATGFATARLNINTYGGATQGNTYFVTVKLRRLYTAAASLEIKLGNTGNVIVTSLVPNDNTWVRLGMVETLDANYLLQIYSGPTNATIGDVFEIDDVKVYPIDPSDTTQRQIDVDNQGEELDIFDGIPINIHDWRVYAPGERP